MAYRIDDLKIIRLGDDPYSRSHSLTGVGVVLETLTVKGYEAARVLVTRKGSLTGTGLPVALKALNDGEGREKVVFKNSVKCVPDGCVIAAKKILVEGESK